MTRFRGTQTLTKSVVLLFTCVLTALSAQSVVIDPQYVSLREKRGYRLLLEDDFDADTLNLRYWDISTSNPADDTGCDFYAFHNTLNAVHVRNGRCIITAEKATAQNSDCPLKPDCETGIGGEIKTLTWRAGAREMPDFEGHVFENYTIPVGAYVEARIRVPDPACNVGAAFWLYGGDQEIDVFETSAKSNHQFTCGYYSSRTIRDRLVTCYQRYRTLWDKVLFSSGKFPKIVEGQIEVQMSGNTATRARLHTDFVTFAVRYTEDSILCYLNGERYFAYALSTYTTKYRALSTMAPKYLRFGAGQITGGGHTPCKVPCSSSMEIDYVRVYLPIQQDPVQWLVTSDVLKGGQREVFKVSYLPSVEYQWSGAAFQIEREWSTAPTSNAVVTPRPDFAPGLYPIQVDYWLPDGYHGVLKYQVRVE